MLVTASTPRREVILARAGELFAHQGVAATSIREIAERVGCNSGTLYHYFESKDVIAQELVVDFLRALRERYALVVAADSGSARERLGQLIRGGVALTRHHRDAVVIFQEEKTFLKTLPQSSQIDSLSRAIRQHWLKVIHDGVEAGEFRDDIDPSLFHRVVRDAVFVSSRGYRHANDDQLSVDLVTMFVDGFAPPPNRRPAAAASTRPVGRSATHSMDDRARQTPTP
jgi:AcrR family transcriptional regulator